MTVIAYRNGVLAADTLVTSYGTRTSGVIKILAAETSKGERWLIGGCGALGVTVPARLWVTNTDADLDKPIDFSGVDDSALILIDPTGRCFYSHSASPFVSEKFGPFHAIGSGADAARAAMLMGANARVAVDVAKEIETSCGGGTVWMTLDGDSYLELPKEFYNPITDSEN